MARFVALLAVVPLLAACSKSEQTVAKAPAHAQPPPPVEGPVDDDAPGLEVDDIRRVVEAEDGAVRGCHTIEYSGRDSRGGTMTVDLAIGPSGEVESAIVVDSDFDSEPMQQCVVEVTRALRFPEAPGSTEVSWRFKFRAPQG